MPTDAIAIDLANEVHAALCLAMTPGVGPRNYRALVDAFGTPRSVLEAAPSLLREVPGVGAKLTASIARAAGESFVADELQRCRDHHIKLLPLDSPQYPARLTEIADPPCLLFSRGDFTSRDELAIAIVGTRHATNYGIRQADRLARGLAMSGFTIISGLARGVDAAAHRGALSVGGRTIAVLGSGLLNLYPPEHGGLAKEIEGNGALLSEFPTLQSPKSGAFPQRNRIVTGLALGVIVIEAGQRSGALISARHAMEQGREVFAVPGQVDNRMARGCHQLIRDGAKLVESVEDVIEELGPMASPMRDPGDVEIRRPAEMTLNEQEQVILQAVQSEPTPIDQIVESTGLPVHRILSTLSVLEMRHMIRRVSGSSVCRN